MKCKRCNGTGRLLEPFYDTTGLIANFKGDICFVCNGTGNVEMTNFDRITASPEALAEFIFYIFSQICNDNICEECAAEWCKNKQGFKKADVVEWLKQESTE